MSSTVSKTGLHLGGSSTDQIKFSELRTLFLGKSKGKVSASDLIRDTSVPANDSTSTPVVPDATENANIASTQSNWKLGSFNQSIKYYDIIQSDTDEQYDIAAQSWNSNLGKNIVKKMIISGTCGASSSGFAAARFNSAAYNLTIEVSGSILGYGGVGGTSSTISGEAGGRALRVSSTTGRIIIDVKGTGQIYGGGGGGERGKKGADGSSGSCYKTEYFYNCGGCPGCPSGWQNLGCSGNGHCGRKMSPAPGEWGWGHYWSSTGNSYKNNCKITENVSGGIGGQGGDGGNGRGYNNLGGDTSGAIGESGTSPGNNQSTSNFTYSWSIAGNNNDALLAVSGSGGKGYVTVELRIDTNDNAGTNGQSYNSVVVHNGPSSSDPVLKTWGFSQGTRTYSWNATAKTYRIEIKKDSGVPASQTASGGIKLRDNDGNDTNAFIDIKSFKQSTQGADYCSSGYTVQVAPTNGADGETGGSGGDWGQAGGNTTNTGTGGAAGEAIYGSYWSLTGSTGNVVGPKTKV